MRRKTCKQCGEKFETAERRRKFCNLRCCWQWRRENKGAPGQFKPGALPWNTGTKGLMKANSGSFQPGRRCESKEPIGAVTIRTDKTKRRRAWVKVSEHGNIYDWEMRATVEWEKVHGPLPDGVFIHHKDRDTLNDHIDNLQPVTRAVHLKIHRPDFEQRRKNASTKAARAARKRRAATPEAIL